MTRKVIEAALWAVVFISIIMGCVFAFFWGGLLLEPEPIENWIKIACLVLVIVAVTVMHFTLRAGKKETVAVLLLPCMYFLFTMVFSRLDRYGYYIVMEVFGVLALWGVVAKRLVKR